MFRFGTIIHLKQHCLSFLSHVKQIDTSDGMAFENLIEK